LRSGPPFQSLATPAPNGFHVYRPKSRDPAVIGAGEKECGLFFVALTGSFFPDGQKIKEGQYCFLRTGPGKQILIKQKNPLKISPELLILNPGPPVFEGSEIPLSGSPKPLSIPALKSIAALLKQNSQSAAARWMNELLIRSFVYASRLPPHEKQNPKISHDQIKTIQNELQGLNTRDKTVFANSKMVQRLYHRTPKKLRHEKIMESAMEDLIQTAKTLDQIARQSDDGSREFFITAFKKHFGETPASLRISFRGLSGSPFS
jgi:hypothetical protein